jgi:DNA end-binding protein Ku
MQQTNRAAICWLVLRSKRHLAALQPRGDLMLLTTLLFGDEIVGASQFAPILPSDLSEREVDMAELLVNTLAGPFEPERYRDEYRERLQALIEATAGRGQLIEQPEPAPPPAGVEDLMAALKASIDHAKAAKKAKPPRRQETG